MSLRVLSYAINGRGLGHLSRQLAILRWVRRVCQLLDRPCECWLLTSSEADTLARREGFPALKFPSKAMLRDAGIPPARHLATLRAWVLQSVALLRPDVLVADTFPGGSLGELAPVLEMVPRRVLVARRVRGDFAARDAYRALLPLYQRVIEPDERGTGPILLREPEELLPRERARRALGVPPGRRAVYLSLGGGGELTAAARLPRLVEALRARGWHVVVGAGPLYQGPELRGEGVSWLDRYVPVELLPGVDAALAGAGYNTFHELMAAGVPTVFLPLPRIADDQLERARRAERAGAGRVARSEREALELLDAPGDPEAARALVPRGGALRAALAVLDGSVPESELELAGRSLGPDFLRLLARWSPEGRDAGRVLKLARLLAGPSPARRAEQRAVLAELSSGGLPVPELPDAGEPLPLLQRAAELVERSGAPLELALALFEALHRKFPGADGPELLAAAERLFPCWARFDDWMGAVSLLRAVPVQRSLGVGAFAEALCRWLDRLDPEEQDLYDAVRAFSRLEAGGRRSVAEALALLAGGES